MALPMAGHVSTGLFFPGALDAPVHREQLHVCCQRQGLNQSR